MADDRRGDAGLVARCGASSRVAVEASSRRWAFGRPHRRSRGRRACGDSRKTRLKAGYAAKTDRARRAAGSADALRRDMWSGSITRRPPIRDLREFCCRYRCHLARHAGEPETAHPRAAACARWFENPGQPSCSANGAPSWLETLRVDGWAGASLTGLASCSRCAEPTRPAAGDDSCDRRGRSDRARGGRATGIRPGVQRDPARRSRQ